MFLFGRSRTAACPRWRALFVTRGEDIPFRVLIVQFRGLCNVPGGRRHRDVRALPYRFSNGWLTPSSSSRWKQSARGLSTSTQFGTRKHRENRMSEALPRGAIPPSRSILSGRQLHPRRDGRVLVGRYRTAGAAVFHRALSHDVAGRPGDTGYVEWTQGLSDPERNLDGT